MYRYMCHAYTAYYIHIVGHTLARRCKFNGVLGTTSVCGYVQGVRVRACVVATAINWTLGVDQLSGSRA